MYHMVQNFDWVNIGMWKNLTSKILMNHIMIMATQILAMQMLYGSRVEIFDSENSSIFPLVKILCCVLYSDHLVYPNCFVQWFHGNIIQPIILFSDQEAQTLVELLETYLGMMGVGLQYYKLAGFFEIGSQCHSIC